VQLICPHPNPSPQGEGLPDRSGSLSHRERARVRAVLAGIAGKSHIASKDRGLPQTCVGCLVEVILSSSSFVFYR